MINSGLQKTTQKTEELFNGKGLKAKHMIFVGLFHSNAGKNVIDNFS
jgi:hypothetical protein